MRKASHFERNTQETRHIVMWCTKFCLLLFFMLIFWGSKKRASLKRALRNDRLLLGVRGCPKRPRLRIFFMRQTDDSYLVRPACDHNGWLLSALVQWSMGWEVLLLTFCWWRVSIDLELGLVFCVRAQALFLAKMLWGLAKLLGRGVVI